MLKKAIRLFAFMAVMNAITTSSVLADNRFYTGGNSNFSLEQTSILLINNALSVKQNKVYDEANDTAFRTFNGGPTEGPQHGYFAVPLIIIGLTVVLLIFIRKD